MQKEMIVQKGKSMQTEKVGLARAGAGEKRNEK